MTLNAGFFPRKRVLGVTAKRLHGAVETFDEAASSNARASFSSASTPAASAFPNEKSYVYKPLVGRENETRWTEAARETLLKNYNQRDMFI